MGFKRQAYTNWPWEMAQKARVNPHPGHCRPVTAWNKHRSIFGNESGLNTKLKTSTDTATTWISLAAEVNSDCFPQTFFNFSSNIQATLWSK
jgi:hypothetical protein